MNYATSVKHLKLPIENGELGVCVHECVFRKAQGEAENSGID